MLLRQGMDLGQGILPGTGGKGIREFKPQSPLFFRGTWRGIPLDNSGKDRFYIIFRKIKHKYNYYKENGYKQGNH